jgi:hypothetical protein
VKAGKLRAHAKNWRLHPEGRKSALTQMLSDVGFVGALIVREVNGQLDLLDGHLRADIAGDDEVPVLIEALDKLLDGIELDENAALPRMISDLTAELEKGEVEKAAAAPFLFMKVNSERQRGYSHCRRRRFP